MTFENADIHYYSVANDGSIMPCNKKDTVNASWFDGDYEGIEVEVGFDIAESVVTNIRSATVLK